MHAIVLVITVFFAASPGVPEHAKATAFIVPSAQVCTTGGAALVSQLMQEPGVVDATWGCFDVTNTADKPA